MASLDAAALHRDAIVVDGHSDVFCDVALRRLRGETNVLSRLHLPAWREGGVNVVVTALYVEEEHKPDRALRRAVTLLGAALDDIAETPEVTFCTTRDEIDAAVARGQIAFVLAIEGGECIQDGVESLSVFHRLGLRVLSLTWNQRNMLAEGVGDERANAGLTELGRRMVKRANQLGILMDVSHLTVASFWDLLEVADGPVIATHSNARKRRNHRRNLDDDQILALAATGGTIGINFVADFVHDDQHAATIAHLVGHIDHIVELVGTEHVALGPDYVDYLPASQFGLGDHLPYPQELETIRLLPRLTEALVAHGYSEAAIRGMLGENFLRVLTHVIG
jgi:membrane dipeptidase